MIQNISSNTSFSLCCLRALIIFGRSQLCSLCSYHPSSGACSSVFSIFWSRSVTQIMAKEGKVSQHHRFWQWPPPCSRMGFSSCASGCRPVSRFGHRGLNDGKESYCAEINIFGGLIQTENIARLKQELGTSRSKSYTKQAAVN